MEKLKLQKDLICFDLDGTLIDSSLDIAHCVNLVMNEMGEKEIEFLLIKSAIGRGVMELLKELMPHKNEEFIVQARERFLAHYEVNLHNKTSLFEGTVEILNFFLNKGKKLAIVTNKGIDMTNRILKHFNIYDKFNVIVGANSLPLKKPSPEPLLYVLETLSITKTSTIFIGDSKTDSDTAKNAEIDFIGAMYGFRTEKEVTKEDAVLFIDNLTQLKDIII